MAKDGSKLNGLSNAFFNDSPYQSTGSLARRQLVELQDIEAGQRDASLQTRELVSETTRSREVAERMLAPLLRDLGSEVAQGNEGIQERLRELQTSFTEGNAVLSSSLSGVGDQISGIPRQSKSIEELLASGAIDEAETVILAASRVLERSQAERFFRTLPAWKVEIIRSGLVTHVDVKAEQALTTQQKVFLAQLRRKTVSNPADFKSLTVFARQGFLDAEIHEALSERIPGVRFGVEGLKHELRDLGRDVGERTSVMIGQGDEMIRRSDTQIGLQQRIASGTAVAITQRDMALRLMKAGVLQTQELVGVERQSLSVQSSSLSVQQEQLRTSGAMLGEINRLGTRARSIDQNTASTARSAEVIAAYSRGILGNTADIRDATHSIASDTSAMRIGIGELGQATHYYGSLQAAQMDDAQGVRLAQVDLMRALVEIEASNGDTLVNIAENMAYLAEVSGRQLDELTDINEGVRILRKIGTAQLETQGHILDALGDLRQTLAVGIVNVVQVVDTLIQTVVDMDARATDRDNNSEKNLARQSFQKAMEMLKIGKIDRAIKFFDESEDRWPADFKVYFQRGLCYVLKNDPRAAEEDFLDAIKLASDGKEAKTRSLIRLNLARLYYGEAKVHFNSGRQTEYEEKLLESIEEAKRAVGEDPKFLEAQFGLATYLAAYKLFDEALKILVKIIPKNPDFAHKLDHFDVFTPIRESLKNTLGEDKESPSGTEISRANLNIAKDCVSFGDFETAKKCLNFLFEKDPEYLNKSKIWELPEFAILTDDIVEMTKGFLRLSANRNSDWGYAVIGIALHLPGIGRGSIYRAFEDSVKTDDNFKSKSPKKIRKKLDIFADDKIDLLIQIIKTKDPKTLPEWLIKSL